MSSGYFFDGSGSPRSRVVFKLGYVTKIDRIVVYGQARHILVSTNGINGGSGNGWRRSLSLCGRERKIVVIDSGYDGFGDGHLARSRFVGYAFTIFDDVGGYDPAAIFQDNGVCGFGRDREQKKQSNQCSLAHTLILTSHFI